MIRMDVDTAKITKLKEKFARYGPYAIKSGLKAMNDKLNTVSFLMSMAPPSQSGQPFIWSSERQRIFVFANIPLPSMRTYGIVMSGRFEVNENSFWIEYENRNPAAKYLLHPTYQIIGHRLRGWKPVTWIVKNESPRLVSLFKPAAINAWEEMDAFITGGGGGL